MYRHGWRKKLGVMVAILFLAACKEPPLYSELSEQQANEIEAALLSAQLNASKVRAENGEDWAITLPKEHIPQAMAILKSQGLPRFSSLSMGDIFRKEGFVSSPMEERARYLYALSQELSNTLMQIEGVASARVHVALPEQGLLEERSESASVAVVIIQQPGIDLRLYETDFKAIITDGVEGVTDVNRVTVKFFSRGSPNEASLVTPSGVSPIDKNIPGSETIPLGREHG